MSQIKKIIASLTLGVLLLGPIAASAVQNRRSATNSSSAQRRARVRRNNPGRIRREKAFQLVWQTVNAENFDPTFGGVNWAAVRSRYAPRVARVTNDHDLHVLLQEMLNEIPQSHFAIIPPDRIPRIKSRRNASAKEGSESETFADAPGNEEEMEADNEIATRMLNGIGIDLRFLNGEVVITRVDPDGPGARAGLRIGFAIKSVDGTPLDNIPSDADISPALHMRMRQLVLDDFLGGEPGTDVLLAYLDEGGKERQAVIKRERLKGALSPSLANVPPLYTELETKRLRNSIGYIRFTVFTPQLAEKICGALKSMRDAPGIIIDLRGNPGGVMGVASGVVGLLTNKAGLIGILRRRSGSTPIPTFPQRSAYSGPMVVLIDRLSASTSEVMAAALQELGRAKIVGERSAGEVLGASIKELPTGALFEYAQAGFKTSEGAILEGKGVTPDVERKLDRNALLRGEDNQLQEALRQVEAGEESAGSTASAIGPPPPPVVVGPSVTMTLPDNRIPADSASPSERAPSFKSTPQASLILEKSITALGGREALERIKSRVSVGVCTFASQGLKGKVVIYEQAPDKRSMEIEIPNLGVTKVVYDGERGWMQSSMMGFYEYKGAALSDIRREFDFYRVLKYRDLYSEILYSGAIDTDQGRVEILEIVMPDGKRDERHFDAKSGLLVYAGGTKLSDYRQVDDIKLPFSMTLLTTGIEMKIQLEQVTHNVPIPATAFAQPQSCFTGQ